jgi:hypothetical protein
MGYKREISEAIRAMTLNDTRSNLFICTVSAVDVNNKLCEAVSQSDDTLVGIPNIHLNLNGNDGFTIFPAVGSEILIIELPTNERFAIQFDEIEHIEIVATNPIIFNGGANNGLVKVIELTTKLTDIEKYLNDLFSVLSTAVPSTTETGLAGIILAITSIYNQTIRNIGVTTQSDLEDTQITH